MKTMTIEDLYNKYFEFKKSYPQFKPEIEGEKEQVEMVDEVLCWTAHGWSPIKRIVRHRCTKRIFE
jgi:hypothetical protein